MSEIQKVYTLSIVGGKDAVNEVEALNTAFDKLRKVKQDLNEELGKALLNKESVEQVELLRKKLSEVEKEMGDISKQQQKSTLDDQRAAKAKELLAKAELANAKAARERTKSIIEQEKELDRLISKEEKAKRAVEAQAGSYNALKKELRELYAIVNAAPKGSAVVFQGNTLGYDQAIQKLKELSAAEQDYRRQFAKDQLLVGEYTTGIIQAFKQLGADDLIGGQIQKANDKLKQLDQTFKGLKADYDAIKNTGVGAFDAIEKEMLQNRKEAESIKNELQGINNRLQSVDQVGTSVTTALKDGFKGAVRELTTYALGFASLQALLNTGRKTFDTTIALDSLDSSLRVVSRNAETFKINQDFLAESTDRLGLEVIETSKAFKNFFASYTEAGGSGNEAREIFDSATTAAARLKLSQEDVNGALLAFGQIASKGKVQAEELRGQIGERIPGAFAIAARAIGVTQAQLNKMLENGEVIATDFLPKFALELKKTFGGPEGERIDGMQASVNRLKNTFTEQVNNNQWWIKPLTTLVLGLASALALVPWPITITLVGLFVASMTKAYIATAIASKEGLIYSGYLALQNVRTQLGAVYNTAYAAAMNLVSGATSRAAAATTLFGTSIKLLGLGTIITLVAILAASYKAYGQNVDSLNASKRASLDIENEASSIYAKESVQLNQLYSVATNLNNSITTRKRAIDDLISQYPEYFGNLKAEEATLEQLKSGYEKLSASIRENARVQASAKLSAEKQGKANEVTDLLYRIETAAENEIINAETGSFVISELSASQQELIASDEILMSTGVRAKGGGIYSLTKGDLPKIKKILNREIQKRQAIANEYNVLSLEASKAQNEKIEAEKARLKQELLARVGKGDATSPEVQSIIDGLEADLNALKLNDPKRKEIEAEIKKYQAILNPKSKTPVASRLTGTQKDEFKEIEANMTAAINAEKLKAAEIRKVRDLTADEEIASLQTIAKIELVALDQKIAKLKGANAEERRLIQEFNLEKTEKEAELQQAIQSVRDRAFDKANAEIKQRFEQEKQALEEQLNLVLDNPVSTQEQQTKARQKYYEGLLKLQESFNFIQKALEVENKQSSVQSETERAEALKKIRRDLVKTTAELDAAQIADIKKANDLLIAELESKYAERNSQIKGDKKLTNRERTRATRANDLARDAEIAKAELDGIKAILDKEKQLFEQGKTNGEAYYQAKKKYYEKLEEINQSSIKRELSSFQQGIDGFKSALGSIIGLDVNKTIGKSGITIGQVISEGYDLARQTMNAYYDAQRARIEEEKNLRLEQADAELQRALDAAQSAEEREVIEKKFQQKKLQIEKEAGEKLKKQKRAELAISLAAELANIAVQAAANPANAVTFGAAGATQFAILAGIAIARSAVQLAAINKQQFAEGGQVQPVDAGNGKLSMASNIPMQPNGDNVLATVRTGEVILNEKQQRALGGAATFARIGVPGFAGGGLIGESINRVMYDGAQAPVVGVDGQGNLRFGTGETAFDSMLASIEAQGRHIASLNERTDKIVTAVLSSDKKSVVATEVEAKIKSKKAASDYASF